MSLFVFLNDIAERVALEDFERAIGLVIDVHTPSGDMSLIGPFAKDTARVLEAIDSMKSEEDPDERQNSYTVRLLFPTSSAFPEGSQNEGDHLPGSIGAAIPNYPANRKRVD